MAELVPVINEEFYGLRDVQVLWADYEYWKKIFVPRQKKNWIQYIDSHLCSSFGYVSKPHIRNNEVHKKPELSGKTIHARRPQMYGRSSVRSVQGINFDVKGTGLQFGHVPLNEEYSTGLFSLGNACVELIAERLTEKILSRSHEISTASTLAILTSPIVTKLHSKSTIEVSSAILVRRSLRRPQSGDFFPIGSEMVDTLLALESEFRKFGITSTAFGNNFSAQKSESGVTLRKATGGDPFVIHIPKGQIFPECREIDLVNIQVAYDDSLDRISILDFEHFSAREIFDKPICVVSSSATERCFEVVAPDDQHFVKFPQLRIPASDYIKFGSMQIGEEEIVGKRIFLSAVEIMRNSGHYAMRRFMRRVVSEIGVFESFKSES